MTRRDTILGYMEDMVSNLLYYDRKEDEDLPRGAIEEAIKAGEVTSDEMIKTFGDTLKKGLAFDDNKATDDSASNREG